MSNGSVAEDGATIPAGLRDTVATALFAYLQETHRYLRSFPPPSAGHDACCETNRLLESDREVHRLNLAQRRTDIRAALVAVGADPDE